MNSGKFFYKVPTEKKTQIAKKANVSIIILIYNKNIFFIETTIKIYPQ